MKFIEKIFSITNEYKNNKKYKIITVFGLKIKMKIKNIFKNKISFKTFNDMSHIIRKNIKKIPNDIDLIVGIPRSGIIPAYMIGLFMNKNVISLNELINGLKPQKGERSINDNKNDFKNILIVDDSLSSGNQLKKTKELLQNLKLKYNIKYCCIYTINASKHLVDFYFEIVEQPRIFQWNYLNHSLCKHACFDIDGVLCINPTQEQNDDGEKYRDFILNATPLYIPTYRINSIVTSRFEKYRKETELWLKKYNIQYDNLYMLNNVSAKDRRELKLHAKYKAQIYAKKDDCILFVESDRNQAIEIVDLTAKACICVETDELFQ